MTEPVAYVATLSVGPGRRVYVPVAFDPDERWGTSLRRWQRTRAPVSPRR
jgi:hypothetical protein